MRSIRIKKMNSLEIVRKKTLFILGDNLRHNPITVHNPVRYTHLRSYFDSFTHVNESTIFIKLSWNSCINSCENMMVHTRIKTTIYIVNTKLYINLISLNI